MVEENIDEASPLIISQIRNRETPIDRRSSRQRKWSMWLILLSAGFERLAFYSLAGNLVLFLTSDNIHWTPIHSVTVSFIFLGITYISALIFAWISDGKVGRAKTIIFGFILYLIGYVLMTLFTDENHQVQQSLCGDKTNRTEHIKINKEHCFAPILSTLICTAIGVGAVQANMAVFGAEQVRGKKETSLFFDRYYAVINFGGLVAFAGIAYAQQNKSYFIGYVVPAGILAIALILFLSGYRFYLHVHSADSMISKIGPVFLNAYQTWKKHRQQTNSNRIRRNSSSLDALIENEETQNDDISSISSVRSKSSSFLDYAKLSNQGQFMDQFVDDVKSLRRIIVVFLLLTPYWLLYFQIETTFLIQGVHMRVPEIFPEGHEMSRYMPIIWLSLGDQIIIIITLFILNTFVYKRLDKHGRTFSHRSRVIVGMLSATLAMCIAGVIEIFRQESCDHWTLQFIGRTNYNASDMSIFYQLPQYVGIGLSEVFTSVASLEFAYLAAPRSAQSLIMSLRFCSAGLSSFVGSLYLGVFALIRTDFTFRNTDCVPENGKTEFHIYFFGLAAIQLFFVLIFVICDRKYQILKISRQRLNTRLFVTSNSRSSTG